MEVPGLISLDRPTCLELLRGEYLGRLAFSRGDAPDVVPVNYCLDGESVVIRLASGPVIRAIAGSDVAFEIDGVDESYHAGWSVVVRGRATEVTDPEESARLSRLPLRPWAPGTRDRYVLIDPEVISGRRLGSDPPAPVRTLDWR